MAADHPDIVAKLKAGAEVVRERWGDDLTGAPGRDLRPVGRVDNPKPLATYDPSHPYIVALYDGKAG